MPVQNAGSYGTGQLIRSGSFLILHTKLQRCPLQTSVITLLANSHMSRVGADLVPGDNLGAAHLPLEPVFPMMGCQAAVLDLLCRLAGQVVHKLL